jgi:hypothetical protein
MVEALPPRNGMGSAALVLGLVSLVAVFLIAPLGVVLGAAAVACGVAGRRRARRGEATNPGQATAGLVTGAVGLVVSVTIAINVGVFVFEHRAQITNYGRCLERARTPQAEQVCRSKFERSVAPRRG